MKVWTCNNFVGHWPVGSAAVVVADTAEEAADILEAELEECGLSQTVEVGQMKRFVCSKGNVSVLCDGNY